MNNIEIIASGNKWIGDGIIPTMSAISELIDNSEDSLIMTIYVLTSDLIFDNGKFISNPLCLNNNYSV